MNMNEFYLNMATFPRLLYLSMMILTTLLIGFDIAITTSFVSELKDWLWSGKKGGPLGWLRGNGFDWYNIVATCIGGAIGFILKVIFHHYCNI